MRENWPSRWFGGEMGMDNDSGGEIGHSAVEEGRLMRRGTCKEKHEGFRVRVTFLLVGILLMFL